MDPTIRQRLTDLSHNCEQLAKTKKYDQCIDIMEEVVGIKKDLYGVEHIEFEKASQKLCEYLNLAAMVYLQKDLFEKSHDLLKKAELVSRNSIRLRSVTYNNLACYYRRMGKTRTALTYLIQALDLELKLEQPKSLADTHLNLCAVLSQLQRHQDALQHSMLSIILLQDEFLQLALPAARAQGLISDDRLAIMTIAYHNMGVEFEHLKRFEEAVKIYQKALKISREHLPNNEQLLRNLSKVVDSATANISDHQKDQSSFESKTFNIYKDLERQIEKTRNLPRLRAMRETSMYEPSSRAQSQAVPTRTSNQKVFRRDVERGFATRNHPRYYRSNGGPEDKPRLNYTAVGAIAAAGPVTASIDPKEAEDGR